MGRGFILFDHLVIAGDVLVEHVTLPEALVAELAVVGVHVGEVDVLDVLVGGASVLEGLGAEPTAEAKQRAAVAALQVLRETGLGALCHKGKKVCARWRPKKPIGKQNAIQTEKLTFIDDYAVAFSKQYRGFNK